MVRRQGKSAGTASRLGTPLLAPGFTSSRNTVSYSSVMARPRGVKMRRLWVVSINVPVLPSRTSTSVSSISRRRRSPTRSGAWKARRAPAYMRRGSGSFGSTPVPEGVPSGPSAAVGTLERK